jgi:hypothetical protein
MPQPDLRGHPQPPVTECMLCSRTARIWPTTERALAIVFDGQGRPRGPHRRRPARRTPRPPTALSSRWRVAQRRSSPDIAWSLLSHERPPRAIGTRSATRTPSCRTRCFTALQFHIRRTRAAMSIGPRGTFVGTAAAVAIGQVQLSKNPRIPAGMKRVRDAYTCRSPLLRCEWA